MAGGSLSASRTSHAIRIAQGLAVILIVLFHTNDLLYRLGYSFNGSRNLIIIFGPALLSLFFFVAGRSLRHRHRSSLANFVANRTSSYLWIFIIWNIIHIIALDTLKYSQLSLSEAFRYIHSDILSTFNFRDIAKFLIIPSNVTWFVYYIFIYLAISCIFVIFDIVYILVAAIFAFDIAAWYFGKPAFCVIFQYFEIFMLAYLVGDFIIHLIERSSFSVRLVTLILYVISCYAVSAVVPNDFPIISTVLRVAGLISLIQFSLLLQKLPQSRILSTISNFVLPIYLMHPILLYLSASVLRAMKFTTDSFFLKIVSTPVLAILCIVSCLSIFTWSRLAGLLIFRPKGFRPMAFLTRLDRASS